MKNNLEMNFSSHGFTLICWKSAFGFESLGLWKLAQREMPTKLRFNTQEGDVHMQCCGHGPSQRFRVTHFAAELQNVVWRGHRWATWNQKVVKGISLIRSFTFLLVFFSIHLVPRPMKLLGSGSYIQHLFFIEFQELKHYNSSGYNILISWLEDFISDMYMYFPTNRTRLKTIKSMDNLTSLDKDVKETAPWQNLVNPLEFR